MVTPGPTVAERKAAAPAYLPQLWATYLEWISAPEADVEFEYRCYVQIRADLLSGEYDLENQIQAYKSWWD
jgi:hypothetical protein